MCNISGFWFREKVNPDYLIKLVKFGRLRGTDGFGITKINLNKHYDNILLNNNTDNVTIDYIDTLKHNSDKHFENMIQQLMKKSDDKNVLFLSNHRSAPETEESVDIDKINETMQPIVSYNNRFVLVHNGSVSNFIVDEMKQDKTFAQTSILDSEAILWAYKTHKYDMLKTMEYLTGGFSFILFDDYKNKLYIVCSHNPLFCGYVRGCGMFWSSTKEAIWSTISLIKGTTINRNNIVVWEDYYCRQVSPYTIEEIDIDSGCINEFKFEPRYVHPQWDPYIQTSKNKTKKVLVACSGGLDSSTTLAVLKNAGYDCTAIHFKYGHRGEECEEIAVKNVTNHMDIPLLTFEIPIIKQLDTGILTNPKSDIQTGTNKNTKTTYAWTTFRNHLFETYMGAIAESEILKNNYENVFLAGGHLQLSESGSYPDNSERFAEAAINFFKFSITGTRIKHLFTLCNLLKWEQFILLDKLELLELSQYFISCDRPLLINGVPMNCSFFNNLTKQKEPACGSGRRSWYSSKIAGVENLYKYYMISSEESQNYIPYELKQTKPKDYNIYDIINKILIHEENKNILIKKIEKSNLTISYIKEFEKQKLS